MRTTTTLSALHPCSHGFPSSPLFLSTEWQQWKKFFTTYRLYYAPSPTHRLTMSLVSLCSLWSGEPLWSTLQLWDSSRDTNGETRLTERQTGNLNTSIVLESLGVSLKVCWLRPSHYVIWHTYASGMGVKLGQRGKSLPLCVLLKITR